MRLLQSVRDRCTQFEDLIRKNALALVAARGYEVVRIKRSGSQRVRTRLLRSAPVAEHVAATSPLPAIDPRRYFTVEVEARPGINHLRNALEWLVREAVALGRTPVVFKPRFDPRHNFGHDLDAEWDRYIDLHAVDVVGDDGSRRTIRALRAAEMGATVPLAAAWFERDHRVTAAENRRWDLIVRKNRTGLQIRGVHDGPAGLAGHAIRFRPAPGVSALAARVRDVLGPDYCAVHVRRDDMLAMTDQYPNLDRDTRPEAIVRTLQQHLAPGQCVLIMTNERDRGYFAPLKAHFRVFQYFDFPALRALVEGPTPDNFLLFEVEKLLFEAARVRIHTFARPDGGQRISLSQDKGWA